MIAGIVLAAGRSRRMGRTKALLTLGGAPFVSRVADALERGGCGEVTVVAGPGQAEALAVPVRAALGVGLWLRWLENPAPSEDGPLDSLRLALETLPDHAVAAVVCPVDVPEVTPALVSRLIAAWRAEDGAPLAVVRGADGTGGHPVLFARAVWPELMAGDLAEGARSVVHAHDARAVVVTVAAPPADVDTPDDYARLLERRA